MYDENPTFIRGRQSKTWPARKNGGMQRHVSIWKQRNSSSQLHSLVNPPEFGEALVSEELPYLSNVVEVWGTGGLGLK